jgi:hypothetical protein
LAVPDNHSREMYMKMVSYESEHGFDVAQDFASMPWQSHTCHTYKK